MANPIIKLRVDSAPGFYSHCGGEDPRALELTLSGEGQTNISRVVSTVAGKHLFKYKKLVNWGKSEWKCGARLMNTRPRQMKSSARVTFLLRRVLRCVTRANWRLGDGAREIPTGPRAGVTLLTY